MKKSLISFFLMLATCFNSNFILAQESGIYNITYNTKISDYQGILPYKLEIDREKGYLRLYFKIIVKSNYQIYDTSIVENEKGEKINISKANNINIATPGSRLFAPIDEEFYLEFSLSNYNQKFEFKELNFYENKDNIANTGGWSVKEIKLQSYILKNELSFFDNIFTLKEYKSENVIYDKLNNFIIAQNGGKKLLFFKDDKLVRTIDISEDDKIDNYFFNFYFFEIKKDVILIPIIKENQLGLNNPKINKHIIVNLNDLSYEIQKSSENDVNKLYRFDKSIAYINKYRYSSSLSQIENDLSIYKEANNNLDYVLIYDNGSLLINKFNPARKDISSFIFQKNDFSKKLEFIKKNTNHKNITFIKELLLNETTDLNNLKTVYNEFSEFKNQIDTKVYELVNDKNGYLKYLELFPNGNFELLVKKKLNDIVFEEKKREYYKNQIEAYNKLGAKLSGEIIYKISPNTGRNGYFFFENENDYDNNERPVRIEWTAARCGLCPNEKFIVWGRINVNTGQFILNSQNDAVKMAKDFYKAVDNLFQSTENAISPIAKYVGEYIPDDWASNSSTNSVSKVNIKHDFDNSGLFERLYTEYFIYNCNNEDIKVYRYYKRKEDDGNGPNKWYLKSNTGEEIFDTFQQAQKMALDMLNCK